MKKPSVGSIRQAVLLFEFLSTVSKTGEAVHQRFLLQQAPGAADFQFRPVFGQACIHRLNRLAEGRKSTLDTVQCFRIADSRFLVIPISVPIKKHPRRPGRRGGMLVVQGIAAYAAAAALRFLNQPCTASMMCISTTGERTEMTIRKRSIFRLISHQVPVVHSA